MESYRDVMLFQGIPQRVVVVVIPRCVVHQVRADEYCAQTKIVNSTIDLFDSIFFGGKEVPDQFRDVTVEVDFENACTYG